jgi:uncharacterized RDD family membrane protein YckC
MKCEKCGNDYPAQYYFETPTICKDCFAKLSPEEQQYQYDLMGRMFESTVLQSRIGFWRRLGAALLDFAIVTIILVVVLYMNGFIARLTEYINEVMAAGQNFALINELQLEFQNNNLTNYAIIYLIILAYYTLEIFIGASLGKLILGYQIGSLERTRASKRALILRYFYKHLPELLSLGWVISQIYVVDLLSSLLSFALLVGCFFVFSSKRQAFHDMLAGTAVYYREDILPEAVDTEQTAV